MSSAWWPERSAALVLLLATAAWALGVLLVFQPEMVSNDGAQYLSIARNLLAGRFNATDVLLYEQHFAMAQMPAPQGVFQPAYSYLVAAFIALGASPEWSGLLVSLLCQVVSTLILYSLLAQALRLGSWFACCVSLTWLILAVNLSVVADALSESTLVVATLGSVWCLWRSTLASRPAILWILSGALALLAFETRYAGMFFVAGLGLALGLQWLAAPTRRGFVRICVWLALPVLGMLLTFARNYQLLGTFLGGPSVVEHHTTSEVLRNLYWSVSGTLGWAPQGTTPEKIATGLALLALAGFLFVQYRAPVREWLECPRDCVRQPVAFWSATYVVVTIGALVWMTATGPAPVSTRYLQPLWPFIFLVAAVCVARLLRTDAAPRSVRYASGALLIAALIGGQWALYEEAWASMARPEPRTTIDRVLATGLGAGTLHDCLQRTLTNTRPLFTNEPQQVALALDAATIGLPIAEYASREWDAAETARLLNQYEVEWVLLLSSVYDQRIERGVRQAPYLADLRHGQAPAGFEVTVSAPEFVVLARTAQNDSTAAQRAGGGLPVECRDGTQAHLGR